MRKVLCGIGGIILVLVIFQAGVHVGYRKAMFSYRFGENYYRGVSGHEHGHGPFGMFGEEFPEAHGAMGKILSITPSTIVIEDRKNVEKIIVIDGKTVIKYLRGEAALSDVRVNDLAVVIGTPNDKGEIVAKFIRILPPPEEQMMGMGTGTSTNTPR